MKANFKIISTILIILLASLLIAIMISYYTEPIEITSETVNEFANTNHEISKVISENVSGEIIANIQITSGENSIISGETSEDIKTEISTKPVSSVTEKKEDTKKDQVIIMSEDTMTNKEKRE